MKRILTISVVCLALGLVLTGCSKTDSTSNQAQPGDNVGIPMDGDTPPEGNMGTPPDGANPPSGNMGGTPADGGVSAPTGNASGQQ